MGNTLPRYPVFIPSKGRFNTALTARMLMAEGVPFHLVVEPQEADAYRALAGPDRVLELPFSNQGSSIPARNWIKDYSTERGDERHWQLDDNMRYFMRRYRNKRIYCAAGLALRVCEDFTDRYENIAISGPDYVMFGIRPREPFVLNCHVYSCSLINNAIPHRWRGRYNEDADLCLQVLADGWCTVLFKAISVQKVRTMSVRGGNTDDLYSGDGRLKMARSLERVWPYVVETKRRYGRPQHVVRNAWKRFDTPLRLKPGVDLAALPAVDEYGMELRAVREVRSERLRALVEEYAERRD